MTEASNTIQANREHDSSDWFQAAEQHRAYLLRVAMLQLKQPETAEDLVQDTLLAFFDQAERFRGEASLRTYLVAILKRKIIDHLRSRRELCFSDLEADSGYNDNEFNDRFNQLLDTLFDERGHWHKGIHPLPWPTPEQAFSSQQFWRIFDACIGALPTRTSLIFVQREVFGEEIDALCKLFALTSTNVSVILYRARVVLRQCLETRWLSDGSTNT